MKIKVKKKFSSSVGTHKKGDIIDLNDVPLKFVRHLMEHYEDPADIKKKKEAEEAKKKAEKEKAEKEKAETTEAETTEAETTEAETTEEDKKRQKRQKNQK